VGDPANAARLGDGLCDMPNEWPVNLARHFQQHFTFVQQLDVSWKDASRVEVPVLTIHGTRDRNAPTGMRLPKAAGRRAAGSEIRARRLHPPGKSAPPSSAVYSIRRRGRATGRLPEPGARRVAQMPQLSLGVVVVFLFFLLLSSIRVLKEYERGVVFRLGRLIGAKGPGLFLLIPMIDRMVRVSLRTVAFDVPAQDVITKDNVSVKVNAVVYFRVLSPERAIVEVEDYLYATSQLAQTTLRSVLGVVELDELLAERETINAKLQTILDEQTEPWGIKVSVVEVKNVDLPQEMQRAIARQAEAERERRAKVIAAQGEFQAAEKLAQAAEVLQGQPQALQLRYLQTLVEISAEKNSTTIFPVPIDLITAFMKKQQVGS
jgi:regulator of protease activity HflC (stomatin/prohibitin superfamily)